MNPAKRILFRRYWKRVLIVLVIAVLVGIVYTQFIHRQQPVTSTLVVTKNLVAPVTAKGKVAAHRQADLKFNLPSKVVWVGVKPGNTVRAYQTVASLDSRQMAKELQTALSQYQTQRTDFETTQNETYKDQVITKIIEREKQKSQYALDRSVYAVEIADIVKREASLVSPIAGTVVTVSDLIPGINLTAADVASKIIRVVDFGSIYFKANVDEIDFGKVKSGQDVTVSLDAYPGQSCPGVITRVGQEGEETSGGVVTVPVEVDLSKCPLTLALGLNGEASIAAETVSHAIVIPKEYLIINASGTSVWVQTGNTVNQRALKPVTVGLTTPTEAQITQGLSAGQTVLKLE